MLAACSTWEGPDRVFDGSAVFSLNSAYMWARTAPPTYPALVDYVYMQLTLDREYDDIYGFAYYVDGTQAAGARNISIYLSPTTSFFNGSVCVANATFTRTGTTPNLANCTNGGTIANAAYVTVVKYTFAGSDQLHCSELQILRSGAHAYLQT